MITVMQAGGMLKAAYHSQSRGRGRRRGRHVALLQNGTGRQLRAAGIAAAHVRAEEWMLPKQQLRLQSALEDAHAKRGDEHDDEHDDELDR